MPKRSKKRGPKAILRLLDLEHSKTAILNSLPSLSSRRSYDHAFETSLTGTALSRASHSTGLS